MMFGNRKFNGEGTTYILQSAINTSWPTDMNLAKCFPSELIRPRTARRVEMRIKRRGHGGEGASRHSNTDQQACCEQSDARFKAPPKPFALQHFPDFCHFAAADLEDRTQ